MANRGEKYVLFSSSFSIHFIRFFCFFSFLRFFSFANEKRKHRRHLVAHMWACEWMFIVFVQLSCRLSVAIRWQDVCNGSEHFQTAYFHLIFHSFFHCHFSFHFVNFRSMWKIVTNELSTNRKWIYWSRKLAFSHCNENFDFALLIVHHTHTCTHVLLSLRIVGKSFLSDLFFLDFSGR